MTRAHADSSHTSPKLYELRVVSFLREIGDAFYQRGESVAGKKHPTLRNMHSALAEAFPVGHRQAVQRLAKGLHEGAGSHSLVRES